MITTRRRFATLACGSLAAAALPPGSRALARGEDDGPPNVFFSPYGRPYRAVAGAPYPVVDWFRQADRNGDGKLDRDEFTADAAAFFDVLDQNADGVLAQNEISFYEHAIAPEVLGMRVTVLASGALRVTAPGAQLWLAQYGPLEGGPMHDNSYNNGLSGNPGGYSHGGDPNQGAVLPDGVRPNSPNAPQDPDAELTGAALYSFFREPEPITAADPDYLFSGAVKKARFLAHAQDKFARLDLQHAGHLTLAGLPQSPVQRRLERFARR